MPPDHRRTEIAVVAVLSAWAAATATLVHAGAFAPLPIGRALVIALTVAAALAAYAASPALRAYAASLHPRRYVVFQLWRIPAALAFWHYGAQGLLPEAFVRHAAWGDLLAGALVVVVLLLPEREGAAGKYVAFHLVGLADLLLAVATAVALTLAGDPLIGTIGTYPVALIPMIGVPFTAAAHLVALDVLLRQRRAAAAELPAVLPPARAAL